MATGAEKTVSGDGYTQVVWNLEQDETGDRARLSNVGSVAVQGAGTWSGGSVTIEGSLDETNWETLTDLDGNNAVLSADGLLVLRESPRAVRPVASDTAGIDVAVTIGAGNRL